MIERARRAFQAYVELGPGRTLAKVSLLFAESGQSVSLVTLKRWSSRFCWQTIIRQQEEIASRILCRHIAARGAANCDAHAKEQLSSQCEDIAVLCGTLSNLREEFTKRAELPIDDPDSIKLTPSEFLKVCEQELVLRRRLDELIAAESQEA